MSAEDSADYKALLLDGVPLLDLRAPVEFARGAFPAARNLPLMSDEERAQVGTCYKERGQQAAIELGHRLVGGATREQRLQQWLAFAQAHPDGFLYCFRGGLRSQTVQRWLADAGVDYPRITGGYKAMRQYLLEVLEQAARQPVILIAGRTGSGKTRILPRISRAVDLEGLACHRGSAFGALLEPQPTQIGFENALAIALLKTMQTPGPIFLEDESRLIGRRALPLTLHERMQQAPFVELDVPFAERVEGVLADYIVDLRERYLRSNPGQGAQQHRERLLADLAKLQRRLGGVRYQQLRGLMEAAFDAQDAAGDLDTHRAWVAQLLRDYYDPMYAFQMRKRAERRLLLATPDAVCEWADAQAARA